MGFDEKTIRSSGGVKINYDFWGEAQRFEKVWRVGEGISICGRKWRTYGAQNLIVTVPSLARLGYAVSRLRRCAFVVFDLGSFHRNSPLLIGNSCLVVSDCGLHR